MYVYVFFCKDWIFFCYKKIKKKKEGFHATLPPPPFIRIRWAAQPPLSMLNINQKCSLKWSKPIVCATWVLLWRVNETELNNNNNNNYKTYPPTRKTLVFNKRRKMLWTVWFFLTECYDFLGGVDAWKFLISFLMLFSSNPVIVLPSLCWIICHIACLAHEYFCLCWSGMTETLG